MGVSVWGGFLTNKLMKKYQKIFKNVVAALLGGIRELDWALQKVGWQIDRNLPD